MRKQTLMLASLALSLGQAQAETRSGVDLKVEGQAGAQVKQDDLDKQAKAQQQGVALGVDPGRGPLKRPQSGDPEASTGPFARPGTPGTGSGTAQQQAEAPYQAQAKGRASVVAEARAYIAAGSDKAEVKAGVKGQAGAQAAGALEGVEDGRATTQGTGAVKGFLAADHKNVRMEIAAGKEWAGKAPNATVVDATIGLCTDNLRKHGVTSIQMCLDAKGELRFVRGLQILTLGPVAGVQVQGEGGHRFSLGGTYQWSGAVNEDPRAADSKLHYGGLVLRFDTDTNMGAVRRSREQYQQQQQQDQQHAQGR